MIKHISLAIAFSFLTASITLACGKEGKAGIAPENDMRISEWDLFTNGMTEARFTEIIKSVYDVYTPVFESKGALLVIYNHWSDDTVNANAQVWGKRWVINMYGGMARHPLISDDGFALVACHEVGHFLGGAPKKDRPNWASNEGQSDYFGAMKCLRRVFEKDDNIGMVAKMSVDPVAARQCEEVYNRKSVAEIALCKRIAMAGKSLAIVLGDIHGKHNLSLSTPDSTTVTKTNEEHPEPQCRLDTYFNGTLCDKSFDQDVDDKDSNQGSCNSNEGYKAGVRPRCWFMPPPKVVQKVSQIL